MGIIFTNKLSKMVAQYQNLRDMIFDLNTSLDISWEKSIQYHVQDLTLNDISSQNEVRASRYLTLKNNKITVEEEQQDIDKLGKLCIERKAWQHYVYQAYECALHGTYVRATGIELYRNDFTTTTQLQVACMQWIPKTYLIFNL